MDDLSMTERFWIKETINYYKLHKEKNMNPKDVLILDAMLCKVELSEKTDRALAEMRNRNER